MRRSAGLMVLGGLAAVLVSSSAQAQAKPYVFFGGGVTFPMGDFKDEAKTGWLGTAGLGADLGSKGLWIEAEGYYGSNKHKAPQVGNKTNIIAAMGAIGYSFSPDKKASPYVTAGAGILAHQFRSESAPTANSTESKFGYTGAVGIGAKLGAKASFWVEGRFLGATDTRVIAAQAGLSIHFGK